MSLSQKTEMRECPRPGIVIQFAEKDGKTDISRIQLAKTGEYYHDWYGGFVLTADMFKMFLSNWKEGVYGSDLMIDYNHCRENAAGWIKDLYLSDDETQLWAVVDWTATGRKDVEEKNYRYTSIDFSWNHMDNETTLEHGPVLYGACLTNRPFIKGMAPATELNELNGGIKMTLKDLQDQNAKLSEEKAAIQKDLDAKNAEIKTLGEKVKASDEQVTKLNEEMKTLKAANELALKEQEFATLLSEGKAVPAQKEAFLKGDMKAFVASAVKLNEKPAGHGQAPEKKEGEEGAGDDKDAKVQKLAEEKFAKGGFASMGDALSAAMKEIA